MLGVPSHKTGAENNFNLDFQIENLINNVAF